MVFFSRQQKRKTPYIYPKIGKMSRILNAILGTSAVTAFFMNVSQWLTKISFNVYATVIITVLGIIYLILRNRRTSAEIRKINAEKERAALECEILKQKISANEKTAENTGH